MSPSDLSFDLELPQGAASGRFRLLGMTGHEALGRLFEFRIRFVSDKPAIDPLKVLGEKASHYPHLCLNRMPSTQEATR